MRRACRFLAFGSVRVGLGRISDFREGGGYPAVRDCHTCALSPLRDFSRTPLIIRTVDQNYKRKTSSALSRSSCRSRSSAHHTPPHHSQIPPEGAFSASTSCLRYESMEPPVFRWLSYASIHINALMITDAIDLFHFQSAGWPWHN